MRELIYERQRIESLVGVPHLGGGGLGGAGRGGGKGGTGLSQKDSYNTHERKR